MEKGVGKEKEGYLRANLTCQSIQEKGQFGYLNFAKDGRCSQGSCSENLLEVKTSGIPPVCDPS